jgi:4-amino-4-deoxy-L-arabinose transferase-like glycosyltransferase
MTAAIGINADRVEQTAGNRPPLAIVPLLWVSGAFVALEMAVSARYGFHRDELYFLACARHLAWGYVDQPPFVPAVAWTSTHLFGTSAVSIRVFPAVAGGVTVLLTAAMARELGGGRKAQVLAAGAAATSPQVVATFHLLSTASFDLMFWSALSFLALRLLRTGEERLWLAVGAVAGLGLLNKWTIVFLLAGLFIALLVGDRRRMLLSRWFWAGAALALVIWSPNLDWNARHDWAAVSMMHSLHTENSTLGASLGFIPSQVIVVGPVLIVFWLAGLRRVLRTPFARPIGVTYLVLLGLFTLIGAKSYYLAGLYFVLFAAGGAWAEERIDNRARPHGMRRWLALMLAGLVISLPLALPVLPETALPRGSWEGQINKDLSATVGWPQFVGQIARISASLPTPQRRTLVVFTGDYGAAGAIDLYGRRYGLPPAISGHNNYWWWGPAGARNGATTIAVDLPRSYLLTIFSSVTPAGTVTTPHDAWTEERGDPIWICTGQKVSWAQAWPEARHYG